MKRSLFFFSILMLALSSCGTRTINRDDATETPPPAQYRVPQDTTLYAGPGVDHYERLTMLPAGTLVEAAGTYKDFVKVTFGKAVGFVGKEAVEGLPADLPELGRFDVPWEADYAPDCYPVAEIQPSMTKIPALAAAYDPGSDSVTFTNTDRQSFSPTSEALPLSTPLRIQIRQMEVKGKGSGGIFLMGVRSSEVDPDTWWKGMTRMFIWYGNGSYALEFQDGSSENVAVRLDLERSANKPIQFLFEDTEGRTLTLLDENDNELNRISLDGSDDTTPAGLQLPDGLFPNKRFYFGAFVNQGTSMRVTGLAVGTQPAGQWLPDSQVTEYFEQPGLARLANGKNLTTGTEYFYDKLIDLRYCTIMNRDFNTIIISDFNWPYMWKGSGVLDNDFSDDYDFSAIDQAVIDANVRGWRVRASHLVWGEGWTIPDWLKGTDLPPETYENILKNHVQQVMRHFEENGMEIQEWSVANELPERVFCDTNENAPANDYWFARIKGERNDQNYIDYLKMVFGWVRDEDPGATLIFNSGWNYLIRKPCGETAMKKTRLAVDELNSEKRLIDAVGVQMHLDSESKFSKEDVKTAMKTMAPAGSGVKIFITEMDVVLSGFTGAQPERWGTQAGIYRDVMEACMGESACTSFATWDISDAESWATKECSTGCLGQVDAEPLLFDQYFTPKPAYFAVREALSNGR